MTAPLQRPRGGSVDVVRPMFQVIPDDAATCTCHAFPSGVLCSVQVQRITPEDYESGRRLL